jgi:hypothetical protein
MKAFKYYAPICVFTFLATGIALAQVEKNKLILGLSYYNDNNQVQYLKADTKAKINGKFKQISGIPVSFYISSESPAHLLGRATTDDHGIAALPIPATARDEWNKSPSQSFLVVSDSSQLYGSVTTSFDLTKARIKLDTAEDKKIVATLVELKESKWVPVKGVDMRIAVKRQGGDLNVNETPTFTTDSLGVANADFKHLNLPGDPEGKIVLIARVEDNDLFGNLSTERTVPWGTPSYYISDYNKRSLFARSGRPPLWLLWMASSITLSVWFVIGYLFFQIWKLKKLGAQGDPGV